MHCQLHSKLGLYVTSKECTLKKLRLMILFLVGLGSILAKFVVDLGYTFVLCLPQFKLTCLPWFKLKNVFALVRTLPCLPQFNLEMSILLLASSFQRVFIFELQNNLPAEEVRNLWRKVPRVGVMLWIFVLQLSFICFLSPLNQPYFAICSQESRETSR